MMIISTKKIVSLLLTSVILILTGCSLLSSSSETDRPYDSNFGSAKEWAEYWCGSCEQLDMRREDRDADDYYDYVEYYTMKDSEYGFTYTVTALYKRYGSIFNKPKADYSCYDFDKYYMQEFMRATDFSPIADKYDLSIDINDEDNSIYLPGITMWTDLELTDEEAGEILTFTYYRLEEFDQRRHFTMNEYCTSVGVQLHCAPTQDQREAGIPHNGWSRMYGYVAQ